MTENSHDQMGSVELVENSVKRRQLFEGLTDVCFAMDADLRFTFWNKASEELVGAPEEEVLGKSWYDIFPPTTECVRAAAEAYRRVLLKRTAEGFIINHFGRGRRLCLDVSAYPNPHGVTVIARDITERRRVEAALLESEQRVRRLNKHILNMVMVLSHDIRGPLVAIASILKLMLRGAYGKLDQNLANTVQDLLSRCARLLGTAEDYLGKASIVGGSMEMEREVLDLRQDIIDAVLDELADDITRREIVIDNRLGAIPSGSIAISANKTWLKAVYRNLFTNAVKYGGKGCTISFGFEQRESHYRLNVYNSGRPIAEEDRKKIFDRFERIEPSEGPTPDGVGLGLCLCREIIIEHGGDIWYEARPDGSNFVFTISRENECKA